MGQRESLKDEWAHVCTSHLWVIDKSLAIGFSEHYDALRTCLDRGQVEHVSGIIKGTGGLVLAQIRLMSWNIQKLSDQKANSGDFLQLIANVVDHYEIDILGIMEVTADPGNGWHNTVAQLLANMQQPGTQWGAVISEQQVVSPYEAYVYLYRDTRLAPTPVEIKPNGNVFQPFSLTGVLSDDLFDDIFSAAKIPGPSDMDDGKGTQDEFWRMLDLLGYIDQYYTVRHGTRVNQEPKTTPLDLDASGKGGKDFNTRLSIAQRIQVRKLLLRDQQEPRLTKSRDRAAFGASFLVSTSATQTTPLPVTLYHAPGPSNPWRYMAINSLAYFDKVNGDEAVPGTNPVQVHQWSNGVVMGDFNVDDSDPKWTNQVVPVYAADGQRVRNPFVYTTVFRPLLDAGYQKQLTGRATSTTTDAPQQGAPFESVRRSTYDNFYVKQGYVGTSTPATITPVAGSAQVVPLISNLCEKQPPGLTHLNKQYVPNIAVPATHYFANATSISVPNVPQNTAEAWDVYRNHISDHLPIMITLDVP